METTTLEELPPELLLASIDLEDCSSVAAVSQASRYWYEMLREPLLRCRAKCWASLMAAFLLEVMLRSARRQIFIPSPFGHQMQEGYHVGLNEHSSHHWSLSTPGAASGSFLPNIAPATAKILLFLRAALLEIPPGTEVLVRWEPEITSRAVDQLLKEYSVRITVDNGGGTWLVSTPQHFQDWLVGWNSARAATVSKFTSLQLDVDVCLAAVRLARETNILPRYR